MYQGNPRKAAVFAAAFASFLMGGLRPTSAQAPPAPTITLDEAIARARTNEPSFAAAAAQSRIASLDRSIAQAALLPTAVYHNQFIYTQPAHGATGSANASVGSALVTSAPRFIANNTVHEYVSQGVATETIGVQQVVAVSRATASAAVAQAELEIARRGLIATVINLFYTSLSADRRVTIAQRAVDEAAAFSKLTGQREQARESAHADVVKAQLLEQQRQRELANAAVEADKAHLELGVLLLPDPRSPFALTAPAPALLPSRADIEAAAARSNPRAAERACVFAGQQAGCHLRVGGVSAGSWCQRRVRNRRRAVCNSRARWNEEPRLRRNRDARHSRVGLVLHPAQSEAGADSARHRKDCALRHAATTSCAVGRGICRGSRPRRTRSPRSTSASPPLNESLKLTRLRYTARRSDRS